MTLIPSIPNKQMRNRSAPYADGLDTGRGLSAA